MPTVRHTGLIFAICLICLGAAATAVSAYEAPLDHNGLPQWVEKVWTDAPIRLELRDHAELQQLLAAVPIAAFNREDVGFSGDVKNRTLVLRTRVTEAEFAALTAAGWSPERVRDLDREGREAAEQVWRDMAEGKAVGDKTYPYNYYPTHAEIGTILAAVETAHPAIARDFQWGSSVQGRALWGIVISDNVNVNEAEPEIRFSSTMHGDEVTGMILMLDLAEYLTTNYGVAGYEDVTYLVDNYEIHLMPDHNPDGTAAGQRYNAHSIDLNRNYLLPQGTDTVLELENQNMINYSTGQHFVISLNFHGGALVANYPWDWTYTLSDDNPALIKMSLEYSTYNSPMYNGSFPQGITNGADWYVVYGSHQDWSYDQTDCIDVTLEVSNTKWPSAGTLVGFWNDNRESLMHYAKSARYGVNGIVTGSDTGLPLDATVTVTGNSMEVHTDPENGDYYKLLDTGTYALTFEAYGYITQTITGVSTVWGTPTVLDVVLDPVATGAVDGFVYEQGGAPIAARVDAYTHPLNVFINTAYSAAGDGSYSLPNLVYGDYKLVYSAADHATVEQVVTVDASSVTAPDVTLGLTMPITPFATNFDGQLTDGWTGAWGIQTGGADGTAYSMSDSPGGNYAANTNSACTMDAGVDLSTMDAGSVSFWARWDIEANWDGVSFEVSTNGGGAWTKLATTYTQAGSGQGAQQSGQPYFEGSQAAWVFNEVDLAPWLGLADVRFRFVLGSDGSVQKDGFTFDEFMIDGVGAIVTGADNIPVAVRLDGVSPNPFNPSTNVRFTLARDGLARLDVFDVTGRLVRTLVDGRLPAGDHAVTWNGRNDDGSQTASGLYFVRLRSGGVSETAKALLVK